jgi:hypothetical protein
VNFVTLCGVIETVSPVSPTSSSTAHSNTPPETAEKIVPLAELLRENAPPVVPVPEIGGRKDGPDPTRYGDWEKNGRCIDF